MVSFSEPSVNQTLNKLEIYKAFQDRLTFLNSLNSLSLVLV